MNSEQAVIVVVFGTLMFCAGLVRGMQLQRDYKLLGKRPGDAGSKSTRDDEGGEP